MRRTVSLFVVGIALAGAVPAGAATTLGSTSAAAGSSCGGTEIVWSTDSAFTVPAGGGVITSMATTALTAAGTMSFKVVRGSTVIGTSALTPVAVGTTRVTMHVPVTGGEFIGLWTGNSPCTVGPGGPIMAASVSPDPPVGTTINGATGGAAMLAVEATLEPDADHDGFGDETEDSCPTDPTTHQGPCQADVGLTQSVNPSTIGVGDVAVATVTFANGSSAPASGLTLGATTTDGLQIVGSVPAAGCAFTPALSCPIGGLGSGASTVAALVVKGVATGRQSLSVGVTSGNDPNAANNTAKSDVTVEKRQAVLCRVPKLKGLTKAFAKTLLRAVNCALGKAKGKGRTIAKQARKAGSVLPAGTKVNVTMKKK